MGGRRGSAATLLLRAAYVLPVTQPVIINGAVLVRGDRILAVGRWPDLAGGRRHKIIDLGNVTLLPGLINAHCHLDYTHMAGQFPPPEVFVDWLKLITEAKSGWGTQEYIQSWQEGARMLVRTGTTLVGDIEAIPGILSHCIPATPLRVLSFLEMIGITNRRTPQAILDETLSAAHAAGGFERATGLSPHAPYSTTPALLRLTAQAARRHRARVSIHVAESGLEYEMFQHGCGAMHEWIGRSGRDMSDCGNRTPVEHLRHCRLLGDHVLVAHANYLGREDARILARSGTHVVHCPRSHFYFAHEKFPLSRLERAGVNICVGTDSLASVYKRRRETVELNMFEELRALRRAHPRISAPKLLRLATVNGARALGLSGLAGELLPGSYADLIAVPAPRKLREIYETALAHQGPVLASLIGGSWAVAPKGPAA